MQKSEQFISEGWPGWLPRLVLVITLYLMYSPIFLTDYLMNDEWNNIGARKSVMESAVNGFFDSGRSIDGIYSAIVYRFVGYDPFRVQVVRFLNCSSVVLGALAIFVFLEKKSKNTWFSFLVVLFFFSQRSFQGSLAYSLDLTTVPAIWFSLLAFYVHFCSDHVRLPRGLRLATAGLFLILAMQSMQTYAFFCMVPVVYVALSDWQSQSRKVIEFLLLATSVFLLSALAYKAGLHYWHSLGHQGYALGEQGLEAIAEHPLKALLHALNPLAYWGAFEIWSYPFPFHSLVPLKEMKRNVAFLVLLLWGVLVVWTMMIEFRDRAAEKRQVLIKWLAVLLCLGFGAIVLVTDSPLHTDEHRPHMTLVLAGTAIFCGAYCWQLLASRHQTFRSPVLQIPILVFVVMTAVGAQAGVLRGYVNNRMEQLDFIRTELMASDPLELQNVVVVLPHWSGCITEPCGPWVGHATEGSGREGAQWHITREGAYRYAMSTVGISPEDKNITFVRERPKEISKNTVIIDWRKYAWARRAQVKDVRFRRVKPRFLARKGC